MFKIVSFLLFIVLPAFMLGACGLDPFGNGEAAEEYGLEVQLSVPDRVMQGESFELLYTIINTSDDNVVVTTPHACLFSLNVERDGTSVPMQGASFPCATVVTDHTIPAQGSVERSVELHAVLEDNDREPLPAGMYTIVAVSDVVSIEGETGTLPDIDGTFIVE